MCKCHGKFAHCCPKPYLHRFGCKCRLHEGQRCPRLRQSLSCMLCVPSASHGLAKCGGTVVNAFLVRDEGKRVGLGEAICCIGAARRAHGVARHHALLWYISVRLCCLPPSVAQDHTSAMSDIISPNPSQEATFIAWIMPEAAGCATCGKNIHRLGPPARIPRACGAECLFGCFVGRR